MVAFLEKPYRWAAIYSLLLALATVFVLLDAFVIERVEARIEMEAPEFPKVIPAASAIAPDFIEEENPGDSELKENPDGTELKEEASGASELKETPGDAQIGGIAPSTENPYPLISASSYEDENIKITLWDKRTYDTDIHIADIVLSSVEFLKTAFASDSYGRNIKETTSSVAERKNAIFAINGDYYGFRDEGHVLRNGVSYRTTGREDALVLNYDGSFLVANEAGIRKDIISNAWQIWSFGPTLVLDGKAAPDKGDEVSGRSSASNPRTAFGEISPLHYVAIVSDGRDGKNKGLSLQELALELEALGCATAYNLDGGGSSTMYFMGSVINNPTDGRREGERRISDIIYVGYE